MACAIIRGLDGQIEKHDSNPHASPDDLVADNPLSKVPCLVTDDGLPLGLQLIGKAFDEGTILRAGRAIEEAAHFIHKPANWWRAA